jgi:hypothetical protein
MRENLSITENADSANNTTTLTIICTSTIPLVIIENAITNTKIVFEAARDGGVYGLPAEKVDLMSIVLVNGIPKSGTHVLVRAMDVYGVAHFHDHVDTSNIRATCRKHPRHIIITRELRDTLTAYIHHAGLPYTQDSLIYIFHRYHSQQHYSTYVEGFVGWRKVPSVLFTRFEDLVYRNHHLPDIASYVEAPYSDSDYDQIINYKTRTYRGPRHSKWTDVWSPAMDVLWEEYGMPRLNALWGYNDGDVYHED